MVPHHDDRGPHPPCGRMAVLTAADQWSLPAQGICAVSDEMPIAARYSNADIPDRLEGVASPDVPPPPAAQARSMLQAQLVRITPALRAFAQTIARDPSEADDLVQETLLKALLHADQFTPGTNLKGWLFAILRNTYSSHWRKTWREHLCAAPPLTDSVPPAHDWRLELRALLRELAALPPHHREILMLVGVGLSTVEAAQALSISVGTAKSRISRARQALAARVGE